MAASSVQFPELPPALLHTIVPFTDYSQWERKPQKLPELFKSSQVAQANRTKPRGGAKKKIHHEATVTVRSRPQDEARKVSTGSRTSHQQSEIATKLRMLKMQIAAKRASVDDMSQYRQELLSNNISLMNEIQEAENFTHSDVDQMLEKYTKFKGAISKLRSKSNHEISDARREVETMRASLEKQVTELQTKVVSTERLVQRKSRELNVLLNYKEKEFPVKSVRIEQLRDQCDLLEEANCAELTEVELQIAEEWDKCGQAMDVVRKNLETRATQASLATMKRSVHEKAIQNRIMEKELMIHISKRCELEADIAKLKEDIQALTEQTQLHNQSRHKSALSKLGVCLPNTELKFDFPRLEKFPI